MLNYQQLTYLCLKMVFAKRQPEGLEEKQWFRL